MIKLITEGYYDDIQKFIDYNFESISEICERCGYTPYKEIYKRTMDNALCFDATPSRRMPNLKKLEQELNRYICENFDFNFFILPLTGRIGDIRIGIFY